MALTDLADWENKIYLYSQYILGSMVYKHVSEPYLQGSVHPPFTYMTINIAYSHNIEWSYNPAEKKKTKLFFWKNWIWI